MRASEFSMEWHPELGQLETVLGVEDKRGHAEGSKKWEVGEVAPWGYRGLVSK